MSPLLFRTTTCFSCCQPWKQNAWGHILEICFLKAVLPNPLVVTRSSQNIEMFTAKGPTSLKVPVKVITVRLSKGGIMCIFTGK